MRILIIGGTGLTGPHIVRNLAKLGHDIVVFHRGQTRIELPAGVRSVLGDQNLLANYADELKGFGPEIVLHMVAATEKDAQTVMDTFRGIARRVVAISSQDVYRAYGRLISIEPGRPDAVPLTEDAPLRRTRFPYRDRADTTEHRLYRYEKILVETAIMGDPELPGTILRYPMVYGPRDSQHRLFPHLKRMDDGRPAILLAEGQADWRWTKGFSENVAVGATLAVTSHIATGRIYNVGERDALTEADWVRSIGKAAGWRGEVVVVPRDRAPNGLAPDIDTDQHLVTDTSRIREELGYDEPISLQNALSRTVAWERASPPETIDPQRFDYAREDQVLAALD